MKTKHTPGPWVLKRHKFDRYVNFIGPSFIDGGVCQMDGLDFQSTDPSMQVACANAQLIAAAPDMMEVLVELKDLFEGSIKHYGCTCDINSICGDHQSLNRINEVIAKATGGAK